MTYKIDHDKLDYLRKIPNFTDRLRKIRKENDCELGEAVDIMYKEETTRFSGWVIEFKDGRKIIVDEDNYRIYQQVEASRYKNVACESHYFDLHIAIKRYPKIRERFIYQETYEKLMEG
jgi:hypothetical protein